jgi:threonine dehydrogenase-like Zn-dependent dehydrogenase
VKAAILHRGEITVGEIADLEPGPGQALVRTHRCALCASDQHFLCSGREIVAQSQRFGDPYASVDLDRPIVMGHEFVGEIVDYGASSRRSLKTGTRVTSIDENLMMAVPNGMPDDHAALVEPIAVGLEHARVGEAVPGDVPLVIGCGAIGLAVIAGLRLAGVSPIIAADLDPGRRAVALRMGADIAVDPREVSPYTPFAGRGIGAPNLVYECVGKPGLLN